MEIIVYVSVCHLLSPIISIFLGYLFYLFIYLPLNFKVESAKMFCDLLVVQRTLSSLELPRAVSVAIGQSSSIAVGESPLDESHESSSGNVRDGRLSVSEYNGRSRQKHQDPARDLSIHVLEKFSLVTKFARETTSQIFGDAHTNGFGSIEKRRYNQSSLDHPQKASNSAEKVANETPLPSDPLEVNFSFI